VVVKVYNVIEPLLHITEPRSGIYLVEFTTKQIVHNAPVQKFGAELRALVDAMPQGNKVVLDFSDVEMSGSGLVQLMKGAKLLRTKNSDLLIVNSTSPMSELIRISHLDKILDCRQNPAGTRAVIDELAQPLFPRH
jgi:anti-anti-sigma factor